MIHNRISSISNLARTVRDGIVPGSLTTLVQTETLKLLLETLIELAEPAHHAKFADAAARTVASQIAPSILDQRNSNG
jgi:hypothetical protein